MRIKYKYFIFISQIRVLLPSPPMVALRDSHFLCMFLYNLFWINFKHDSISDVFFFFNSILNLHLKLLNKK